jgi:hypothetical protein
MLEHYFDSLPASQCLVLWNWCVLCPLTDRCRDEGDAGGMRQTSVQQHGPTSRPTPPTGSAPPPPVPPTEVRYPFGVQNDFGQVILSGGAKVSPCIRRVFMDWETLSFLTWFCYIALTNCTNVFYSSSSLGAHPAPIQWVPGALSLGGKVAGAWSWPLTSI